MLFHLLLYSILVLSTAVSVRTENNIQKLERQILDKIFDPKFYDKRIRPGGEEPVTIKLNCFILNFKSFDEVNMQVSLQFFIRQFWNDKRLAFDSRNGTIPTITLNEADLLWMPDLFIPNEADGKIHQLFMPNIMTKITSNGDVLLSRRMSVTLFCEMNLKKFPFDVQNCPIKFESYAYTAKDLIIEWRGKNPVMFYEEMHLQHYYIKGKTVEKSDIVLSTGHYSCATATLVLARKRSYFIGHFFFPTLLFVLFSWLGFWIHWNHRKTRIFIPLVAIFLHVLVLQSVGQHLPAISYNKATDIWSLACFFFILGSILEFGIILLKSSYSERLKARQEVSYVNMRENSEVSMRTVPLSEQSPASEESLINKKSYDISPVQTLINRLPFDADIIDKVSRYLFPIAFLVFNIVYWIIYLT